MSSGALFPGLASGSRSSSSKYLVEFRAGKMTLEGSTVTPDKRKGMVFIQQTDDSLIHFCWKDRTTGNVEDDLIIFPDDCEFKRVSNCTTGRVFVLKFKAGTKRLFFWMQEPKTDKDEEYCRKVNEYLNSPPVPGSIGSGGSGGHELSALGEGGLQNLLGNISRNQLMQLIGPTGLGGLGRLGALAGPGLASLLGSSGPTSSSPTSSHSTAATPSESARLSTTQAPTPPPTPAATSTDAPTLTPTIPAPQSSSLASGDGSHIQPIQLNDLQSILATMNVPAMSAEGQGASLSSLLAAGDGAHLQSIQLSNRQGITVKVPTTSAEGQGVDLAGVLTPDIMAPILMNPDVQQRLLPYLPSGKSLPQSAEEIQNTLTSPQFQQAMSMFSSALASGQLGPLMNQFGLSPEVVDAANKGDVEAFAKAMENSGGTTDESSDAKKRKDDDEDMSLD